MEPEPPPSKIYSLAITVAVWQSGLETDLDRRGTHTGSSLLLIARSLMALPVDPGPSNVEEEEQGMWLELE